MSKINWTGMQNKYKELGPEKFTKVFVDFIKEGKISVDDFSLTGLWKALGEPAIAEGGYMPIDGKISEAVNSSAIPTIVGTVINKAIIDAYTLEYGIGMQLVEKLKATQQDEVIVGFTASGELKVVNEAMPYEATAFGEKYCKIKQRKFGRILSLTEEAVRYDHTAQLIMRAKRIGEDAKNKQEEIIMKGILEYAATGDYATWRPAGTAATLYSDTSTDPYTTATLDNNVTDALADETDVDAAITKFASYTDEEGKLINVNPKILLTSVSKYTTGLKIVNSTGSTVATNSEAVINPYQNAFTVLRSPFVDSLKGANYWYVGDFKKQFVYVETFPLEIAQAIKGNDAEFNRDILYSWRVRFMGGCGAVSNRYVVQSTGAG